jgi:hypothetical protein
MLIVNNLQDITREYSQQYTQKSPLLCLAGMSGVSFALTPLCGTGQRAWRPPTPKLSSRRTRGCTIVSPGMSDGIGVYPNMAAMN